MTSAAPQLLFTPDAQPRVAWTLLFAITLLLLATVMWPLDWRGNEINYFDLAHAQARPDLYGPDFAVRDASQARVFSFTLIGSLIEGLGFDLARQVLAFALIGLLAAGYAALALGLGLSVAEGVVALALYVLGPQALMGEEWVFVGVEAKTLAYAAVLPGLALASRGQAFAATLCLALATWFHFLVGGFWALAMLLLLALGPQGGRQAMRSFLLWALAIAPLFWILLWERINAPPVDPAGLDRSLAEIYGLFRNSHHVAPFASLGVAHHWMHGLVMSTALAALFVLAARRESGAARRLALWLALLNAYLLIAMLLAFLDRDTHRLAPLYMFRPAGLTLLLSLMGGTLLLRRIVGPAAQPLTAVALVLALAANLTPLAQRAAKAYAEAPSGQLLAQLDPEARALVTALQTETPPDAVLLIEPKDGGTRSDGDLPRVALERLSRRATLVNWKFVPTLPDELARWYRLWQLRAAVFAGDCTALVRLPASHPVSHLVLESPREISPARACGRAVWQGGRFTLLAVTSLGPDR